MPHAADLATTHPTAISVIDFRRQSMRLDWHASSGTWTACEDPPPLVHGVALIRASQPNICIFGRDGDLHLQVDAECYALSGEWPRVRRTRGWTRLGLRKRFSVESSTGEVLFGHQYWASQGDDFFRWLVARASDPGWRASNGRRWSDGLDAVELRSS